MLLYIGRLVLLRFSTASRAAVGVVAFDIDVGVSLDSALGASSVMFVLPVSAGSTASANAAEDDISLCCSAAGSVAVGALFLGSFSARAVAAPTSAVAPN